MAGTVARHGICAPSRSRWTSALLDVFLRAMGGVFGSGSVSAVGAASAVLVSSLVGMGCQSLADLDVHYCADPPFPYVEKFDEDTDSMQSLLEDRCWRIDDGKVGKDDNDIKLEPVTNAAPAASWREEPPRMVRYVEGNFVLVAQAEVATGGGTGDFCDLEAKRDRAGIIVRSASEGSGALAALLLEPFYEDPANRDADCKDEADNPPSAQVHALALDNTFTTANGVGADGEAEIAVCRQGSNLYYYYHDRADDSWVPIQSSDGASPGDFSVVGDGPVEVGVVTTLGETGASVGVQGTFNWVLLDAGEDDVAECASQFDEEFRLPEPI